MANNILKAPVTCSVGNLEAELSAFYHNVAQDSVLPRNLAENDIVIDLSSISYFEVPAMIFLPPYTTEGRLFCH